MTSSFYGLLSSHCHLSLTCMYVQAGNINEWTGLPGKPQAELETVWTEVQMPCLQWVASATLQPISTTGEHEGSVTSPSHFNKSWEYIQLRVEFANLPDHVRARQNKSGRGGDPCLYLLVWTVITNSSNSLPMRLMQGFFVPIIKF